MTRRATFTQAELVRALDGVVHDGYPVQEVEKELS